jgi:F0F1-type ATP synthase delta subunit
LRFSVACDCKSICEGLADVSFKLNQHEQVQAQNFFSLKTCFARQQELALFYSNPAIAVAKKKAATKEILGRLAFGPTASNLLLVLIDNHRMGGLTEIRKSLSAGVEQPSGSYASRGDHCGRVGRGDTPAVDGRLRR